MRRTTCILTTLTFILSCSMLAASVPENAVAENRLAISIYDFAHIGPKTLSQAERVAGAIFAAAGIETQWTVGSASDTANLRTDFSAIPQSRCTDLPRSGLVRVQIYSRAPQGFGALALGYSLPCAEHGIQVTLFADRMEAVSASTLAIFYRVLGHALAHEVGHVLLRSAAHESTGLMKGVWTKADWQRASVTIIPFAPEQARRIAEALAKVDAPADFDFSMLRH